MDEDEFVDKLGDMAEVLCELASTDIQMAVEPAHRLDWHTLRTVAGMLDKLAEGTSAADIMNDWVEEHTPDAEETGEADYEVMVTLPRSFDRGHNGLIKDALYQQLGDSVISSGGNAVTDQLGIAVRVPASASRRDVEAKAKLMVIIAAYEMGDPLKDLPSVDEVHRMDR